MLSRPIEQLKIITCHLGNGASIAAIRNGQSIDTTMGMTPLEGVPMGTRSGSIDPAIIEYLMSKMNVGIDEMITLLNKSSGMKGLSGVSSDFREISNAANNGDPRAIAAFHVFTYSVKKQVGAYAAILGGVNALVFTAGVGENSAPIRAAIASDLGYMGLHLDHAKNDHGTRGVAREINTDGSTGKIMVIPTNEELVIARDTAALVK